MKNFPSLTGELDATFYQNKYNLSIKLLKILQNKKNLYINLNNAIKDVINQMEIINIKMNNLSEIFQDLSMEYKNNEENIEFFSNFGDYCKSISNINNMEKTFLKKEVKEFFKYIRLEIEEVDKSKVVDRTDMRKGRIAKWMHRDSLLYDSVNSENSQEMFSIMAQAHGGWTGVGIGNSRECSRLPLAFSDYIFSIIVEEIGLIGGIFVIILYLWLLSRAAMIARRCHRVLPALLIIGMAAMITFQALFHMAINTGVVPVSGEPLPLISKGGTSILVTSVAIGVMLSVSRTISNISNPKNKDEGIALPSGLDAANPTEIPVKNEWK